MDSNTEIDVDRYYLVYFHPRTDVMNPYNTKLKAQEKAIFDVKS